MRFHCGQKLSNKTTNSYCNAITLKTQNDPLIQLWFMLIIYIWITFNHWNLFWEYISNRSFLKCIYNRRVHYLYTWIFSRLFQWRISFMNPTCTMCYSVQLISLVTLTMITSRGIDTRVITGTVYLTFVYIWGANGKTISQLILLQITILIL